MINNETQNRKAKYIVTPSSIPAGTYTITYTISIGSTLLFTGSCYYFEGNTYEIDCSDWIESYLAKSTTHVQSVNVEVRFYFYNSQGTSTGTGYQIKAWGAEAISLSTPASGIYLELLNSGFSMSQGSVKVPLMMTRCNTLFGNTINKMDKVTFMDRYGDTHNGSLKNRTEIECYVDPDWLTVKTGDSYTYEQVMMALQGAKKTWMKSVTGASYYIDGMKGYGYIEMEGRVKDVEKVEVSSSYSTEKKIPSLKITFEVYL